ncbi:MFS transporter [Brevibacillus sp. H7]|uniref:MFS transporter n=1 Tax=Brevibacillus sp. H7 TaxID=3349138 RepID=UPI003817D9FC
MHNRLFRNPSFLAIWAGQAVSELGGSLGTVANGWLVFELTGSKAAVGGMWLVYFLPSLLVQLVSGPYLDRWNRKRVMMVSHWVRGAMFLLAFFLLSLPYTGTWPLYLVSLVNGLVQPLYVPASLAFLPSVLPKEQLTPANAALDGTLRLMMIVGPPVGGLFISLFGGHASLFAVALAYAFSGVLLHLYQERAEGEPVPSKEPWAAQFMAGIGVFREQPTLLWLGIFLSFVQFAVGITMVLNLPYVVDDLQGTSFHYGLFMAGYPLGYFLGSLVVGSWTIRVNRRRIMMGSLLLGGLSFVALSLTHQVWLAIMIEVAAGVVAPFFHVHSTSLYQRSVPNHLLGRVFSVRLLIIRITMPLGVWLGSQFGESLGVRPIYTAMGLLICTVSLLGMMLPYFRFLQEENNIKNC